MDAIEFVKTYHKHFIGEIDKSYVDEYGFDYQFYYDVYCNEITKILVNDVSIEKVLAMKELSVWIKDLVVPSCFKNVELINAPTCKLHIVYDFPNLKKVICNDITTDVKSNIKYLSCYHNIDDSQFDYYPNLKTLLCGCYIKRKLPNYPKSLETLSINIERTFKYNDELPNLHNLSIISRTNDVIEINSNIITDLNLTYVIGWVNCKSLKFFNINDSNIELSNYQEVETFKMQNSKINVDFKDMKSLNKLIIKDCRMNNLDVNNMQSLTIIKPHNLKVSKVCVDEYITDTYFNKHIKAKNIIIDKM